MNRIIIIRKNGILEKLWKFNFSTINPITINKLTIRSGKLMERKILRIKSNFEIFIIFGIRSKPRNRNPVQ